jgi:hypothetical protein
VEVKVPQKTKPKQMSTMMEASDQRDSGYLWHSNGYKLAIYGTELAIN